VWVSQSAARRIAVHAQLLDGRARLPRGKEGVARAIERLGYVQIDTIAVVERAHHHTLWTRRPDYCPDMLHELQSVDRRVFEYWGHQASYLPMSDYRFYLPRMRRFATGEGRWARSVRARHGHLLKPLRERIRQEGPLTSADFKPPPGKRRGSWWDWKPAKNALELLFWRGDLMISERRNFARVYDLTERVLPDDVDTREPDEAELGRFLVRRALSAYGIAREREIADHLHAAGKDVIARALRALVEAGEVTPVRVEGDADTAYYALCEQVERQARLRRKAPQLFILSPFDNLVIQRDRVARLFGFDYTLECYLPATRRRYGYFTLPILWNELPRSGRGAVGLRALQRLRACPHRACVADVPAQDAETRSREARLTVDYSPA
jgi:uncharacterized protein YcaQ